MLLLCLSQFALAQDMTVVLDVKAGLTIKGEDRKLFVAPGIHPMKLKLDENSFSSDLLVFTYGTKKYSMPVPGSVFDKIRDYKDLNATADKIEQDFGMRGKANFRKIRTYTKDSKVNCTYCGLCAGMDSMGNYAMVYSATCDGTQKIRKTFLENEVSYDLQFISKDGRPMSYMKLNPKIQTSEIKVDELTDCE